MKVTLYINKQEGKSVVVPSSERSAETKTISFMQAVDEGYINGNQYAEAAVLEGEQTLEQYVLNDNYIAKVVEIDDAKLEESYQSLSASGYKGTKDTLAKLTAMDIPVVLSVQDILPTSNLTWNDIRDTLNANGGVVNNNAITAFQSGANTQRWAKYKPVVYYKEFTTMDEEWYKGDDLKCGLTIRYSPTDGDIIDIYRRNDAYTYNYLTQGPYRLGDFRGYFPNAEPYIRTNIPEDKVFEWDFNNDGNMMIPIQVVRQSDTSLTINDVKLPLDMGNLNIMVDRYDKNPIEESDALSKDTQYYPITGNFPFVEFRGLKSDYNVQYFLLSLTDKSINGYNVPMPYDEKNAYLIKIKNIAKAVITGSISQFALSTKKVWSNVSDYLETPYDSNGGSSSPVLFKSSIKNISNGTITFNNTDSAVRSHTIKIKASGIVGNEYKEYNIECSVWNGFDGASTGSLIIPASQTKEVIFGTSEGLFDKFRSSGGNTLIYIDASIVNKNTKAENTISSIRIMIN